MSLPGHHCVSSTTSLRLLQDFTAFLPGLYCVSRTSLCLFQDITASLPRHHCVSYRTSLRFFQDFTASLGLHCVSSRTSLCLFQDITVSLPGLHCCLWKLSCRGKLLGIYTFRGSRNFFALERMEAVQDGYLCCKFCCTLA